MNSQMVPYTCLDLANLLLGVCLKEASIFLLYVVPFVSGSVDQTVFAVFLPVLNPRERDSENVVGLGSPRICRSSPLTKDLNKRSLKNVQISKFCLS